MEGACDEMKKFAVYIGRFQPFHLGHLATLKHALSIAEKVVVVIGSAYSAPSVKNPWSSSIREMVIRSCLDDHEDKRVAFVHARDFPYSNSRWSASLRHQVDVATSYASNFDVVLLGHKKDASSFYLDLFPGWEFIEAGNYSGINATKARELMFRQDKIGIKHLLPGGTMEFVEAFMKTDGFRRLHDEFHSLEAFHQSWKGAPRSPFFTTADAVVTCKGHVLLIERGRPPGRGQLALPGGKVNTDERIDTACLRELREETCIDVNDSFLRSVARETKVFDAPERSLRGRVVTHVTLFDLNELSTIPTVRGSDDAAKAFWCPISEAFMQESLFFEDHFHIMSYFLLRK